MPPQQPHALPQQRGWAARERGGVFAGAQKKTMTGFGLPATGGPGRYLQGYQQGQTPRCC